MGEKGTEAAKEAADMVLADDNFASIERAVEEGRTVYANLKKTIVYLLPTNGGEALAVIAAVVMGMTLPITPVQILWVNMVTETTLSLALAFDPTEPAVMRRPPRDPREPLLSRYLVWRVSFVSVLLLAGVLGLFLWEMGRSGDLATARAAAVNALVMGEIVYLFNSRRLADSALNLDALLGNRIALIAVAVLVVLQLGFTYLTPMQALFGTGAMDGAAWGLVAAFGVAMFFVVEAEKALMRRLR
jgi:magnesium-transporting ATPase (P-type)